MGKYFEIFQMPFETTRQLIVGVLMGVAALLTFGLTVFFIFGFAGETLKNAIEGNLSMPPWKGWKRLFKNGFLILVALVAYLLPGWALIAIEKPELLSKILGMFSSWLNFNMAFFAITGGGPFVYFCLLIALLGLLFAPMAIIQFMESGDFGSILNFKTIILESLKGKYIKAWIFVAIDFAVLFVIANILSFVSIIGTALGIIIFLYVGSTTAALAFGNAWHEYRNPLATAGR